MRCQLAGKDGPILLQGEPQGKANRLAKVDLLLASPKTTSEAAA
jgi:hypothetical protein